MASKAFLEDIKALYDKHKRKRKYPAHDNYLLRLNKSGLLLETVLEATSNSETRTEARKNYIVNLVTATELFCIETIIDHRGKWKEHGLANLLNKKETLSLNDVFDLLKIGNVTKEHLLINFYSFQNLNAIDKVFSFLTGEIAGETTFKFLDNLIKIKISEEEFNRPTTIEAAMPDWAKYFSLLFETRHRVIHEDINAPISKGDLKKMIDASDYFAWACFVRFELEQRF